MSSPGRVSDVRQLQRALVEAFTRFPLPDSDEDEFGEVEPIVSKTGWAPFPQTTIAFASSPAQSAEPARAEEPAELAELASASVLQTPELLGLILRAASTTASGKKANVARIIARNERVCRAWRNSVADERLWAAFARAHWRECEGLKGVKCWRKFCASRLKLTRQPRCKSYRASDLQIMATVRLERMTILGCKPSKSLLRTTLQGSSGAWGWPFHQRFEWKDVSFTLPKKLATEAELHGWAGDDDDKDDGRGLVAMVEEDDETEYTFTLSLSLFRTSDQKMCRLFSTEESRRFDKDVDEFRWRRSVDGGSSVWLSAGLEMTRDAKAKPGSRIAWDFNLSVLEKLVEADEITSPDNDHGQHVLRLLNTSLDWL